MVIIESHLKFDIPSSNIIFVDSVKWKNMQRGQVDYFILGKQKVISMKTCVFFSDLSPFTIMYYYTKRSLPALNFAGSHVGILEP